MISWASLGHDIITSAIVVAIVAAILGAWMDRNTVKLGASLKRQTDSDLERLRNDLAVERARTDAVLAQFRDERQTLFVKLHERRSQAMEDVYGAIIDVRDALSELISALRTNPEAVEIEALVSNAVDAGDAYRRVYRRARILFPADLAQRLSNLNDIFTSVHNTVNLGIARNISPQEILAQLGQIDTAPIPRFADEIAALFRKYYGVVDEVHVTRDAH